MSVFDLDTAGQKALADEAAANPMRADDVIPGFFQGVPKAVGFGTMRGGAKTSDLFATVGSFFDEPGTDKDATDALQEDIRKNSIDYWTPQANEVGTAGRVLGGASEMLLPLAATGGNPAVMIGSQAINTGKELVNQGVDANTAAAAATIDAATNAVGFKLPFLGKTLASRVASGVGGNVVLGTASRAATHSLLESSNPDVADKFKPFDPESLAIDTVMGLAFGGIAHLASPSVKPSHVDAALTANNAKHFQHDTAPGDPADINASIAHQDALETAIKNLLNGEPVDVGHSGVQHETFVPKNVEALSDAQVHAAFHDAGVDTVEDSGVSVHEGELTDEQLAAFQGLRSDVHADQIVGGLGEGVSRKQGNPNDGRSGTAAGEPLTVYRGADAELIPEHFNDAALGHATGHPSSGLGVYFTNDAGDAARYGRVSAHNLDIRNPKIIKAEDLPGFDSLQEAAAFREKLKAQGHDGIVMDASHLGGPVHYVAFEHKQVKPAAAEKAAGKPKQSEAEKLPPDVVAAHMAAQSDFHVPTGEFDAQGNAVLASAKELLARAREDIKLAEQDANAFEAAANCFLGKGN